MIYEVPSVQKYYRLHQTFTGIIGNAGTHEVAASIV